MIAALIEFSLAFVLSALLGFAMLPIFRRYALARPNSRSSHREPTPQGGGTAIILTVLALWLVSGFAGTLPGFPIATAVAVMSCLGAADDLRPLGWRLRLLAQAAIVLAVLIAMPDAWRLLSGLPYPLEITLALVLGLWFVNLTNFMDGIDGMLVVGLLPLFLACGTGFFGLLPGEPLGIIAGGALAGFFVLNRPKALLFAGDIGSLALGLIAATLLFALATKTSLVAAILLPLFFVMDATTTLLMRLARRANLAMAHREHAYQRAFDSGKSVKRIIAEVLVLNTVLAVLAGVAATNPTWDVFTLLVGVALTSLAIQRFRRRGPR